MLEHHVRFPLGIVRVKLDRTGLGLGDRGGFEADWADTAEAIPQESYRNIVKEHLYVTFIEAEGLEPPKIALNLASHQLIDDLIGWTKLNYEGSAAVKAKM